MTQEMVARAFKHITNSYLRHLPAIFAASCLSHLLNVLLGTEVNPSPSPEIDSDLRQLYPDGDFSFEKVTPQELEEEIIRQIQMRYRYTMLSSWKSEIKPLQLLREVCLRLGLQLAAREYNFGQTQHFLLHQDSPPNYSEATSNYGSHVEETKKKKKKTTEPVQTNGVHVQPSTTFVPDDILNLVPTIKDAAPKSALAEEALEAGKISLAQGQKQLGQELVLESLSLHEQIYGILHPEVAKMYHALSTIYHQTDEKEAAVELARKAVIVTERTLGVDSHDTVLAYLNLSLFEHHLGNTKQALRYIRHALDVWKIIFGNKHPDSITTINNAAVMLQSLKEYPESRKWFEQAYTLCEELFGQKSTHSATVLFQLAQALALDNDAKGAVGKMRDAYNIFLTELGPNDRNTKDAEHWLEQLTQNAVSLAKHAKDIQARRLRFLPKTGLGTKMQQQSASAASPNTPHSRGTTGASHIRSPTGSVALDSRSIDELMKFIDGDLSGGSKGHSKKKSMNPRARGVRKTETVH